MPIAFLLGTWKGGGSGRWPTSDPFTYEEEMVFEPGGAGPDFPFFAYTERAWNPEGGEILHRETGFWRCHSGGGVDAVLAHPVAVTEVTEGAVDGSTIELSSKTIGRASESDAVTRLERRYTIEDGTMTYELKMATGDVPLSMHLRGKLERV